MMKKSAYLINTARGAFVDEAALADALNQGKIAGYAADVVVEEPMAKDNPLLTAKNTVITPHIAWATREARERLVNIAIDNVKCFVEGHAQNVVN